MKIIAVLDVAIGVGGGFDQALNAILQMQRLTTNRFNFEVFTTQESNLFFLNQLNIKYIYVKESFFCRFSEKILRNKFYMSMRSRMGFGKQVWMLEKRLIQHGCDLVYFVTPIKVSDVLQKLNYISTAWDLCHRENPEFPEVREFGVFYMREIMYSQNFASAIMTITESNQLTDMASKYYGVDRNRFLSIPLTTSPFLERNLASESHDVLNKYSLEAGYYFYPAQFWAHKNHIRILQALLILNALNSGVPKLVFSGKDHGNLNHIKKFIKINKLESQVKILGFVPSNDVRGLYESAMAVVMPTYFGPTNIPPLEAWSLGIPLIYSSQLAEQAGDAALLVDPDSPVELANAMLLSKNIEVRKRLVTAGYKRLKHFANLRKAAEEELRLRLDRFAVRRENWE